LSSVARCPERAGSAGSRGVTTRTVVPLGLWALRVAGVVYLVGVLAQALFAGLFVTGDVGFLDMHSLNASVIAFAAVAWFITSLIVRAPRQIVTAGIAASVMVVAQIAAGYLRILPLHIPLGVVMFGIGHRLVQLAFSHRGAPE
jgi:hypothetical protein